MALVVSVLPLTVFMVLLILACLRFVFLSMVFCQPFVHCSNFCTTELFPLLISCFSLICHWVISLCKADVFCYYFGCLYVATLSLSKFKVEFVWNSTSFSLNCSHHKCHPCHALRISNIEDLIKSQPGSRVPCACGKMCSPLSIINQLHHSTQSDRWLGRIWRETLLIPQCVTFAPLHSEFEISGKLSWICSTRSPPRRFVDVFVTTTPCSDSSRNSFLLS
jgi:hypothetical protein